MNAEALSGTVLGTCTLQKLIGRGGMGAVFQAQQSRPHRQVAVKVLLPMTKLQPNQQAAFLERFRRETDAAASLEHPNITPVHEYGERDGLAYLVMPYISGGTLRDELEQHGQLPWSQVINYLDQMAAALDFAHERGVIHRDIKPANILMTPEKRLLLTDFGLVKVITEGQTAQKPLSEIGLPMGTPDYMAPEQVVGGEVDARADLYSLGIILYQMVTGTVPFKGEMPMKVALQHMQAPPPPPRPLRPDLPAAAEQVILRTLSKRPSDRYLRARDIASAFRLAMESASVSMAGEQHTTQAPQPATSRRRGLFDPMWRAHNNATPPQTPAQMPAGDLAGAGSMSALSSNMTMPRNDSVGKTDTASPSFSGISTRTDIPIPSLSQTQPSSTTEATQSITSSSTARLRLGHKTSLRELRQEDGPHTPTSTLSDNTRTSSFPHTPQMSFAPASNNPAEANTRQFDSVAPAFNNGQTPAATRKLDPFTPATATGMLPSTALQPSATSALQLPTGEYNGETGMLKLAQPVKVVKVPVAGQPGQYMTGILPMVSAPPEPAPLPFKEKVKQNKTKFALLAATFVILLGSLTFLLIHVSTNQPTAANHTPPHPVAAKPNPTATAAVKATATMQANIILTDSLADNGHDWPISTGGSQTANFQNGAYHITANDKNQIADALLPNYTLPNTFVYSLTMYKVKGDDNATSNNFFGMILRYNTTQKNGKTLNSFYGFQVSHTGVGTQYQLIKYHDELDDQIGVRPFWDAVWSQDVGNEFYTGQGAANKNTLTVAVNNNQFTFTVNGKQVGTAQNGDYSGGQLGMMVSLPGTEMAFSNLQLTHM